MAVGLFSPENFYDTLIETLCCYQQRHDDLMVHDLTTGCWAPTTPKTELTIILELVSNILQCPIRETALWMDISV